MIRRICLVIGGVIPAPVPALVYSGSVVYAEQETAFRGEWDGTVERVEIVNDLIITVVRIYPKDRRASFHVTSFIQTGNDKITAMDEYYADDGIAPQWRLDKHIGTAIK